MYRLLFPLLLFLAFGRLARARQNRSTRSKVHEDLEEALENVEQKEDQAEAGKLTQYLRDLASKPVNINEATEVKLMQVPGINLKIARAIINYRESVKPFEHIRELDEVKGIGKRRLEKMEPYVTIGSGLALGRILYTDPHYWMARSHFGFISRYQQTLQRPQGYRRADSTGGYLGSPVKYYQRARFRGDHLSVNLTQEKDPGEPLTGPRGFDFNSAHLALTDNGKLRSLVIGDYSLSFGQGLVLWNGGGFGKGRDVIGAVDRNERSVVPYSSSQETNFYRGVAATYGRLVRVSGFYSYRRRSASEISPDTTRFPRSSGYHRTLRERGQKNDLRQELYGTHMSLNLPSFIVGVTGYKTVFDRSITAGEALYNRYDFSGNHTMVLGIDVKATLGPAILFGEGARSLNNGYGLLTGVESTVGDGTEMTLAYRNYGKTFHSVAGSGFGETSGMPQNEEGIYLGVRHSLTPNVDVSAYIDQYRFPAPRFGTHQPTQGFEWLGLVEIQISRDLSFYLQLRSDHKDEEYEQADFNGRLIRRLGTKGRSTLRLHLKYWADKKVRLRTRGEMVFGRRAGEPVAHGYLVYQDIRLLLGARLSVDGRVTVFDTKSYDSRVYEFENDLLYVMSNKMLYGKGQRIYLLVNYEPFDFLELWAKFGVTTYEDQQIIGSGLNEIIGNKRSEIGLQARIKF